MLDNIIIFLQVHNNHIVDSIAITISAITPTGTEAAMIGQSLRLWSIIMNIAWIINFNIQDM